MNFECTTRWLRSVVPGMAMSLRGTSHSCSGKADIQSWWFWSMSLSHGTCRRLLGPGLSWRSPEEPVEVGHLHTIDPDPSSVLLSRPFKRPRTDSRSSRRSCDAAASSFLCDVDRQARAASSCSSRGVQVFQEWSRFHTDRQSVMEAC